MAIPLRACALVAMLAMVPAPAALSQEAGQPLPVQNDTLRDLEERADELSESARRTIEEFINLIGPMLSRFSRLIDDLPTYEAPELLPNGDIIIRRKRDMPAPADKGDDTLTET